MESIFKEENMKCIDCKHWEFCQKEFGVGEYTEEQSVIGCMIGDGYKNIPEVNEEGEEIIKED
ncbi:hypothetical protein ES703_31962 [subsurface metagenome]